VVQELEKMGIKFTSFESGEIDTEVDLTLPEIKRLDHALRQYGLEASFSKSKLVSRIRNAVHELIETNLNLRNGLSSYVSNKVGYNYYYLNSYFFKETGLAIEEYYTARQENNIRERMKKNILIRSLA